MRRFFIVIILSLTSFLMVINLINLSNAQTDETQDQYEQDIQEIKERIKKVNINLEGISTHKSTLRETIADLNKQISQLNTFIAQTRRQITDLNQRVAKLQSEIVAQKQILQRILVLLYQRSGASTFELIITSNNFSDYLAEQEYLNRLKEGISQSVIQIQNLENKLEKERQQQTKLLEEQMAQEVSLKALRWEQQQLLVETSNQEAKFQELLSNLEAEQEKLEKELQAYLESLLAARTSLGVVNAGDIIGRNGDTGWSTGPHLHLAIYANNGRKYDPLNFLANNNLVWPMGGAGGWVSQGFHPAHQALDIAAAEGTPIRAIAAGNIIHRGCLFVESSKYATFGVIINHGNYSSLYIHLQAPNNPKYEICSINRRNRFGAKSIDYNLNQ